MSRRTGTQLQSNRLNDTPQIKPRAAPPSSSRVALHSLLPPEWCVRHPLLDASPLRPLNLTRRFSGALERFRQLLRPIHHLGRTFCALHAPATVNCIDCFRTVGCSTAVDSQWISQRRLNREEKLRASDNMPPAADLQSFAVKTNVSHFTEFCFLTDGLWNNRLPRENRKVNISPDFSIPTTKTVVRKFQLINYIYAFLLHHVYLWNNVFFAQVFVPQKAVNFIFQIKQYAFSKILQQFAFKINALQWRLDRNV